MALDIESACVHNLVDTKIDLTKNAASFDDDECDDVTCDQEYPRKSISVILLIYLSVLLYSRFETHILFSKEKKTF